MARISGIARSAPGLRRGAEEVTYWPSEHSQLGKLRLVKLEMPARMRALSFERGELVASRCGQLHPPSLSSCCEALDASASCGVGSSRRIDWRRSYAQEGADACELRAGSWNRCGYLQIYELI